MYASSLVNLRSTSPRSPRQEARPREICLEVIAANLRYFLSLTPLQQEVFDSKRLVPIVEMNDILRGYLRTRSFKDENTKGHWVQQRRSRADDYTWNSNPVTEEEILERSINAI